MNTIYERSTNAMENAPILKCPSCANEDREKFARFYVSEITQRLDERGEWRDQGDTEYHDGACTTLMCDVCEHEGYPNAFSPEEANQALLRKEGDSMERLERMHDA